jgi:hypothetical protein
MPNDGNSLWRTIWVPLFVGIVVAGVAFLLPIIFAKGRQISYSIEQPAPYLIHKVQGVTLLFNGNPTPNVYIAKVKLWNSGSDPLTKIPVLVVFSPTVQIFSINHSTSPAYLFGKIEDSAPDSSSREFSYDLLNPNDSDEITLLMNDASTLSLYTKAEGLKAKEVIHKETWYGSGSLAAIFGAVSVLSSLVSELIFRRLKT